jgi:hypothetical protein
MVAETLAMYEEVYDDEWVKKRLEDESICTLAKFYNACVIAGHLCTSAHISIHHICKAAQLSLKNGACQYTPLALVHFAGFAMKDEDATSM